MNRDYLIGELCHLLDQFNTTLHGWPAQPVTGLHGSIVRNGLIIADIAEVAEQP